MSIQKLNELAELLLDTGKRNNLVNFKGTKLGTVELVSPEFETLCAYADKGAKIKVYDPKLSTDDEDVDRDETDDADGTDNGTGAGKNALIDREEYINVYSARIKKGQVLAYNTAGKPIHALKNISKKVKTTVEETGVNILYLAFGFINWFEKEEPSNVMKAPVLLVPVTLNRDSAIEPFEIKIPNDEIIVNPTFAFKLHNDYGIQLPEYDDSAKIGEYLGVVADMLKGLEWTVTSECMLGLFSFQKLNMYRDIKDNAEIVNNNKNIRAIMGESVLDLSPAKDDDQQAEEDVEIHNVVDADSSQLEAIEMAKNGTSFVLQGPPGTGKSQTITNIIAESLADGKTVLFVSEKMAALNVVYEKLKRAGLSEFTLELHSHKANKKQVIDELCHTLRADKCAVSDKANRELTMKKKSQGILDTYDSELHATFPIINKTLYEILLEVAATRKCPEIELIIDDIGSKGMAYIERAEDLISKYLAYVESIGYDYRFNPWYGFHSYELSYQTKIQLKSDLKLLVNFSDTLKKLTVDVIEKYGIELDSVDEFSEYSKYFDLLAKSVFVTPQLLSEDDLSGVIENVIKMRNLATIIFTNKALIDATYDDDVYKFDGTRLYKVVSRQFSGFFSRLFGKEYKKIVSEWRLYKKDGKKPSYKKFVGHVEALAFYQEATREFETLDSTAALLFGEGYKGINSDFETMIEELTLLANIKNSGRGFGIAPTLTADEFEQKRGAFGRTAEEIFDAFNDCQNAHDRLAEQFSGAVDIKTLPLLDFDDKINYCNDNIDQVDSWHELTVIFDAMEELGIKEHLDCMLDNSVQEELIALTLKKAFYTQWADYVIRTVPVMTGLNRVTHDKAVDVFAEKDLLDFEISKAKIKANVSANRPALDLVAQGSAVAILLREGEKKSKQKSIRQLLHDVGDLVQTIKPCFLMSPLSVSTYLDANMKFDLVVFDEASQIFPQDAIGAIYRGEQLIVVGDSKQMPPSNFFSTAITDTEDENEEENNESLSDYESILDICSATFPQRRLKWHYRSRFEELITFSNNKYYENDLVTFPSPGKKDVGLGVDYIYVDGIFDRKSKTNRKEAERIVELVFEHAEQYPDRSLGIVAFSISQQSLIERLIAKRLRDDTTYAEFFKADKVEPFFVKNLETVQGDERDTIIFSIAYAKDSQGKFLYNFGPLNKKGGERRLNVAVTRAKYNVKLVTSLHGAEFDLSHTNSVGVRYLRDYLSYAELGVDTLECDDTETVVRNTASELDMEVCEFLKEHGYTADTKVGCSSFKIDIAVKHPDTLDYLIAIECDGTSYHSSKNTRDRDRLRQTVLENMGWRYYRIWSSDWFKNKKAEKEKLLAAISDAVENKPLPTRNVDINYTDFGIKPEEKHFEFPKYRAVDVRSIQAKCEYRVLKIIRYMLETEAPLSEEWLMRRLLHLYRSDRITPTVKQYFEEDMLKHKEAGIERKDGFLYLKGREIPVLRIPDDGNVQRDIQYICDEELALGMKIILRENISVEKMGLYRSIAQKLGYARVGDNIEEKLNRALALLKDDVDINDDVITLKRGR